MSSANRNNPSQNDQSSGGVLKDKDEFVNPQHKGNDKPSHRVEEMGRRKDPAQKTDKRQSDSSHYPGRGL
jgi:hypothetical protein